MIVALPDGNKGIKRVYMLFVNPVLSPDLLIIST